MKKILSVITILSVFLLLMTGCNTEKDTAKSESNAPVAQETVQTTNDTVDKSNFIGETQAQEIALEKAGITSDDVIFDRIELDRDDGVWMYEVEFRKDRTEYDAEIKADDGTVLSWDVDIDD